MSANRPRKPIRHDDRVLELLAILQLGLCGRCGRACYATRRTARRAARIGAPGARLRAYRCGYRCDGAWHLTSPPHRPQHITAPVTLVQDPQADGAGLDRRGAVERAYRCSGPGQSDGPHLAAHASGRRSGPDPLVDAPSSPPAPTCMTCGGGR
jgi:hypothetical protein